MRLVVKGWVVTDKKIVISGGGVDNLGTNGNREKEQWRNFYNVLSFQKFGVVVVGIPERRVGSCLLLMDGWSQIVLPKVN